MSIPAVARSGRRRSDLCNVRRGCDRSRFAPGTGAPEVGGLTPLAALAILRGLPGRNGSPLSFTLRRCPGCSIEELDVWRKRT